MTNKHTVTVKANENGMIFLFSSFFLLSIRFVAEVNNIKNDDTTIVWFFRTYIGHKRLEIDCWAYRNNTLNASFNFPTRQDPEAAPCDSDGSSQIVSSRLGFFFFLLNERRLFQSLEQLVELSPSLTTFITTNTTHKKLKFIAFTLDFDDNNTLRSMSVQFNYTIMLIYN